MYKYKTPDGNIIHSVVNSNDAKLLYKIIIKQIVYLEFRMVDLK